MIRCGIGSKRLKNKHTMWKKFKLLSFKSIQRFRKCEFGDLIRVQPMAHCTNRNWNFMENSFCCHPDSSKWSLRYTVHGTSDVLCGLMQQLVVIWWCIIEWQQCQCFIEYGLPATSRLLHGLLSSLPLTIFRSNSKFDQNLQCSGLKWICGSQRNCAHVTWRVQDFVVVGQVYFKLEYSKCWSNFEFDRNIVSRMGARSA